jgi:transglutaminase-like putative cysteine protease
MSLPESTPSIVTLVGRVPLLLLLLTQLISHSAYLPPLYVLVLAGLGVFGVLVGRIGTLLRAALILLGLSVFLVIFRSNFSVEMAGGFLLLACVSKLFELRRVRDLQALVFVSIYASAVSFLFVQTFFHTLLQVATVLLSLFCLMRIFGSRGRGNGVDWRTLVRLFVLAMPAVVVCYLFFPRIDPLWNIPVKTSQARSGISDSMSPGDIADLGQSSTRAFRVAFHGDRLPPAEQRYWRGIVLDQFDGRTWTRSSARRFSGFDRIDPGRFILPSGPDTYEIMLEPHFQYWAYALVGSEPASTNIRTADMGLIELDTEAIQATRYMLRLSGSPSSAHALFDLPGIRALSGVDRSGSAPRPYQDLQVPRSGNPLTQAFVDDLLAKNPDPVAMVRTLMRYFFQQGFHYTLQPPVLGDDFVDEFMFQSRRGFCSHYAGSLAYMLRLAGVPARVVLGYQGGEYNADGNYLIVRQYDAHAWVEARISGLGWVQLDPTAMIAPDRISLGLESAVREEGSFLANDPLASATYRFGALSWMRLRLDELNYQWQKWVVNYNPEQQQSLVAALYGKLGVRYLGLLFMILALLVFGVIAIYLARTEQQLARSMAVRNYLLWCWLLARLGAPRASDETPRAYVARLETENRPRLAALARRFTERLEQNDYRD